MSALLLLPKTNEQIPIQGVVSVPPTRLLRHNITYSEKDSHATLGKQGKIN